MSNYWIASLSILTLIGEVGQFICLPLWVDSTLSKTARGKEKDPGTFCIISIINLLSFCIFFILFKLFSKNRLHYTPKIIKLSLCNFLSSFFIPYTSSENRNSYMVQALMINFHVPLTALIR